jgi:predicted permease
LVVTQVALALVLLIAAGLMIRTFQSLRNVQPGFTRPEEVQTVTLSLPEGQVSDPEKVMRIQEAILRKIEEIPGVSIAAFASGVPLDPRNRFDPIYVEGQPVPEGKMAAIRQHKYTSPGIFRTLGNPILAGRDFTWTDIYDLAPVAVVTDNFAREYWGSPAAAVGKRIREMPNDPWTEIIGVVANERDRGVDRPSPTTIYWPGLKRDYGGQKLTVRRTVIYAVRSSRAGSQGFVDEIRKAIWSVNPELPLAGIRTLEEIYSRSMARTSFALVMLAVAGGMALLLGIIGIYGVISYSVSQRTREIGVRMALGAQRPVLTRMFVRDGLKLVAVGLVIGIGGAFALTRAMSSLLFGVSASDPMTYVVVSLGLAVAATFASYLPSRRAMRVDPMVALRTE